MFDYNHVCTFNMIKETLIKVNKIHWFDLVNLMAYQPLMGYLKQKFDYAVWWLWNYMKLELQWRKYNL